MRVNALKSAAVLTRQLSSQPQRPGSPDPDRPADPPREHDMLKTYATLVSLVAFAQDRLGSEEKGATAVEYGLMVGLIAVVIIVAVDAARRPAERPLHEHQGRPARWRRRRRPLIRS